MSSDIYEGGLYDTSSLSSDLELESGHSASAQMSRQQEQIQKQISYFKNQTMKHQEDVTQLLTKYMANKIIVSKNVVPAQLLDKKKELLEKIKAQQLRQTKLNEETMAVDAQNAKIEAALNSSQTTPDLIKKVENSQKVLQKQETLKMNLDKHAKLQADLQIEIELKDLDKELELKARSDAQLIEFFTQKIKDEREKIDQLRKRRRELESRMENQTILNEQEQQEGRRAKDAKLIEDRIRLLESNIERLRNNLEKF